MLKLRSCFAFMQRYCRTTIAFVCLFIMLAAYPSWATMVPAVTQLWLWLTQGASSSQSVMLIPLASSVEKYCADYLKTQPVSSGSSADINNIVRMASMYCGISIPSSMSIDACGSLGQCFLGVLVNVPAGTDNRSVANTATQKLKDTYLPLAAKTISCPDSRMLDGESTNKLITNAYWNLYKNDKNLKWAGMAAYASDLVGMGIDVAGYLAAVGSPDMLDMLTAGNQNVYNDMYWQHLIYQQEGLAGLYPLYASNAITENSYWGWVNIYEGSKNQDNDLLWQGAMALLNYEQNVVLQKTVYNKYPSLSIALSPFMFSPIPEPESAIGIKRFFQVDVPLGNIGSDSDRMRWIQDPMITDWQILDQNHQDQINQDSQTWTANAAGVCQ